MFCAGTGFVFWRDELKNRRIQMYYRQFRPLRDLQNLQSQINRAFHSAQDDSEVECSGSWIPPVDIKELADGFMLYAELPGLKREDIRLTIRDRVLELSGDKKSVDVGAGETYHRKESRHGNFCRKFMLDSDIDTAKITATFHDGILELSLPKAEQVKPKDIEIKTE
jgi:HSP20 family protein